MLVYLQRNLDLSSFPTRFMVHGQIFQPDELALDACNGCRTNDGRPVQLWTYGTRVRHSVCNKEFCTSSIVVASGATLLRSIRLRHDSATTDSRTVGRRQYPETSHWSVVVVVVVVFFYFNSLRAPAILPSNRREDSPIPTKTIVALSCLRIPVGTFLKITSHLLRKECMYCMAASSVPVKS